MAEGVIRCAACGKEFTPHKFRRDQKYCSAECRISAYKNGIRDRAHEEGPQEGIPLREFICAQCRKVVRVMAGSDRRRRFCCSKCEQKFYKHAKPVTHGGAVTHRSGGFYIKLCPVCHEPFGTKTESKVYCSMACRSKARISRALQKRKESR